MVGFFSVEVGLLLISIIIASLSLVVAGFSYTGQLRAQMREALEQLDDTNLSSTHKAKILLYKYSILRGQTTISLRVLYAPYSGGQGSQVKKPYKRIDDESENNWDSENFEEVIGRIGTKHSRFPDDLEPVTKIETVRNDVLITVDSIEPIAVRRVADTVTRIFSEDYSDRF